MGAQARWYASVLGELLKCAECRRIFEDNVAILIADDNGTLTNEQADAVCRHLNEEHKSHRV